MTQHSRDLAGAFCLIPRKRERQARKLLGKGGADTECMHRRANCLSCDRGAAAVAGVIRAAGLLEDAVELDAAGTHVIDVGGRVGVAVFEGSLLLL
jgi:hypothetical protein